MPRLFSELRVGDTLPADRATVTPAWVAQALADNGDPGNPWYETESPFGGPVAPPTLTNADFDRFLRANDFSMSGVVPLGTSHDYFAPVMVGADIVTTCAVVETKKRNGRVIVTFAFETRDPDGRLLLRKRDTLMQIIQVATEAE